MIYHFVINQLLEDGYWKMAMPMPIANSHMLTAKRSEGA